MVDTVEYVIEAERYESQRRLIPRGAQPHQAGVAEIFEGALRAVRRQEPQHCRRTHSESRERWVDREARAVRRDGIFDEHVQQRLLPEELYGRVEGRAAEMHERGVVRHEGAVGGKRYSCLQNPATAQWRLALEDRQRFREPHL